MAFRRNWLAEKCPPCPRTPVNHVSGPYSQVQRHLAAGGKLTIGDSPAINPDPAKRSEKIDPETILKRRKPPITAAERKALRKLAEAL